MKKLGFTLAEVLITLGIVGVVAALTAPALVQNAGSAQIGPKLAKAVNTIEVATESCLVAEGASKVTAIASGTAPADFGTSFGEKLSNYMKISEISNKSLKGKWEGSVIKAYNGGAYRSESGPFNNSTFGAGTFSSPAVKFMSKDGMIYSFYYTNRMLSKANNASATPSKQIIGTVAIDINGTAKPNTGGKDIFLFSWFNDGSLKPVGSTGWNPFAPEIDDDNLHWTKACNDKKVTSGWACAGSIFENNLKIIYQ